MTRAGLVFALLVYASDASADIDLGGVAGWSQQGAFGTFDLAYSPQGFWAVGLSARVDDAIAIEPAVHLRLSADIFRLVPRFQLALGYAQGATWALGLGLDYFLLRTVSLRGAAGYASRAGWNLAGGLAWYPFD
jgi:hypothetical protein